ncbi:MAG: type 1 glutamine amidotransferase domain-containing protein [Kiritimatiellae bacterium]|nr:type 1 glutamine amidotransferase domain-containing protein [Kiritimatiellia bacterium]MDD5519741.1 type 1 glutamine amidotransferase domain-containing protein [Kiritimatiellia bacterium]
MSKKVLVLATNYGAWAEELQAPWDALKKAGFDVTLATYLGKKPLPINISMDPDFVDGYQNVKVNTPEVVKRTKELINNGEWDKPIKIKDAKMEDYDALVMTGGPGNPLDICNNPAVHRLILSAVKAKKTVGAVCYSVGALAFTRDPKTNKSVIYGKTVTAHPRKWDFVDFDLQYVLLGATPDNKGTDVMTPGFLIPLQDIVEDAVGPKGKVLADDMATRNKPCVAYDPPFVTALSVESSIAYGKKLVEVLKG